MSQFIGVGMPAVSLYYHWSVPAYCTLAANIPGESHLWLSFLLVIFTSLTGMMITFAWWRYTDQH